MGRMGRLRCCHVNGTRFSSNLLIHNRQGPYFRRNFGLEDVLPTMTMPCLLYVGEADGACRRVQEGAKHIPNVTYVTLPGCNHGDAFYRANMVLPHATTFLQAVYPSNPS